MLFYGFLIVLFWVLNNVPLWLKIVLTVGTAIQLVQQHIICIFYNGKFK